MSKGKAMGIVKNIYSDEYSVSEKAYAIYLVMNMVTHNSITKADMLNALKWLWHSAYEIKAEVDEKAGEG